MSEWLHPWHRVGDASLRSLLEEELAKEVVEGHPMWGLSPRTVLARRTDQDDILVLFANEKVAEVHLTWAKAREADPRWPRALMFSSIEEWRLARMIPAHEDFEPL